MFSFLVRIYRIVSYSYFVFRISFIREYVNVLVLECDSASASRLRVVIYGCVTRVTRRLRREDANLNYRIR